MGSSSNALAVPQARAAGSHQLAISNKVNKARGHVPADAHDYDDR